MIGMLLFNSVLQINTVTIKTENNDVQEEERRETYKQKSKLGYLMLNHMSPSKHSFCTGCKALHKLC